MSTGSIKARSGAARFSRDVALTLAARVFIAGGSLLAGIIVARWLGAASVGILASLSVVTILAVTLGGFGVTSSITLLIARENSKLKGVIVNAVAFAVCVGGILALGIAGLIKLRPGIIGDVPLPLVKVTILAIPFQLLSLFCLASFLALRRIGLFNALDMLSPAFLVINPIVVLVLLGLGIFELVAVNTAISILLSFFVLGALLREARSNDGSWRPDLKLFGQMLKYGAKFYVALVASIIIFRADLLIVNYFRNAAEAGAICSFYTGRNPVDADPKRDLNCTISASDGGR